MSLELRFVCAILATWRLTHLLTAEDGPADVVVRVRARLGDGIAGRAMDCFYYLSIWSTRAKREGEDHELLWTATTGLHGENRTPSAAEAHIAGTIGIDPPWLPR